MRPEPNGSATQLRVLAISSYGVLGGAELSLASFLEHRPSGVSARALLLTDGPLRGRLEEAGIEVSAASGLDGRPRPAGALRFARSLRRALRRDRPDVVWAVGQKAALLAAPACRLTGVPLVWHKVDFSWDALLARPLAAASAGVITCSAAVAEPLGPFRGRLLGVVWPPVRLDDGVRAKPDPARPAIGTLGRLVPYKGHHHIMRAAARLSTEFPTLRVILAGPSVGEYPDYPESLRRLARELGLDERLELPGFVEDVASVLERLSVYVSATYRDEEGFGLEGLGAGIVEASWAGIPVVAAAGGGVREAMRDGETGTIIPAPEPGLLEEAVGRYLRDPELAGRVGDAGARFARGAGVAPAEAARRLFSCLERAAGR